MGQRHNLTLGPQGASGVLGGSFGRAEAPGGARVLGWALVCSRCYVARQMGVCACTGVCGA